MITTSWMKDKAVRSAIYTWWRSLEHNRGARAALRRANRPAELLGPLLRPAEAAAWQSIETLRVKLLKAAPRQPDELYLSDEALAAVAGLLASVRDDVPGCSSMARLFAKGVTREWP